MACGPPASGELLGQVLIDREALDLARGELDAVHAFEPDIVHPHLAVDAGVLRLHHVDLRRVVVLRGRQAVDLRLAGAPVEARDRALEHHAEPEIPVLVGLEVERAHRKARLLLGERVFRDLAGGGIELPQELLAEIRVPDLPLAIEHDVMRLHRRPRQIVFGDDDARRPAAGTRQRLQREFPFGTAAEIDAGEIFGLLAEGLGIDLGFGRRHLALRQQRRAHLRIARHALQHRDERVGIVPRGERPLQRVTADAVQQRGLLLLGSGHAGDPFGVGELVDQVARLAQREIELGRFWRRHLGGGVAIEIVARGADAQRVLPGLEPAGGEAVAAFGVAHDADRHRGAGAPGADDDAFHRPFLGRAHLAGKRGGVAALTGRAGCMTENEGR